MSATASKHLTVVSRIVAAVVGGYALANAAGVLLTRALPMPRADAVLTAALASFALYAAAIYALFAAWAATVAYAAPLHRAWRDGFAAVGALLVLVPLLNAATTERHLGVSVPTGDWVFAGGDRSLQVRASRCEQSVLHCSR